MAIRFWYGHHDSQIYLFAGCGYGSAARSDGATVEGVEIRSAAPRHPGGGESAGPGRERRARGTRTIAGFAGADRGRRPALGEAGPIRAAGVRAAAPGRISRDPPGHELPHPRPGSGFFA